MEPDSLSQQFHKEGLFGGVALLPLALSLANLNVFALAISIAGFVAYAVGIIVFNKVAHDHPTRAQFIHVGRTVCAGAYLVATVCATFVAVEKGACSEVQSQLNQIMSTQLNVVLNQESKEYKFQAVGLPEILAKSTILAGTALEQQVRLTPMDSILKPIVSDLSRYVRSFFILLFYAAMGVACFTILVATVVLPIFPVSSPKNME